MVMIFFWPLSIILHHVYSSPAARGKPVFRRVFRDVCGDLVRLQAEREGCDFVLASVNSFIPCIFLPGCAGGTGFPAGL